METFMEIVSTLGFPIAVAIYALYNSNKHEQFLQNVLQSTLKENTSALNKLSDMIDKVMLQK